MIVIDAGCGRKKREGAVGIDSRLLPGVDIVADLSRAPWPLRDESVDSILAFHLVEHLPDLVLFMEEAHRVLKPDGTVDIEVPHGGTLRYLGDPTHRTAVTCSTFRYFEPGYPYNFYSGARFKTERMELVMPRFWLRPVWRLLWRRRMWTTERWLVRFCIDFSMRIMLRKTTD
jgi:SAM-dependent methyltransferase